MEIVTLKKLQEFSDVYSGIEWALQQKEEYPQKPSKPFLKNNPSSIEAKEFAEKLEKYEQELEVYNQKLAVVKADSRQIDFVITEYIKDYEEFVNAFKSLKVDSSKEFKLVNGDDIHKYYQMKNYYSSHGSLGGSCMADEGKSTFRVYTENPRKVQLLILIDSDGKIHGRSLVWKLKESPCEAKYFMDRVYTNADSDVIKFKAFAEEKGFLYKQKNNSYIEDNIKFMYKGQPLLGEVKVKLDGDFKEYPFIDTMCFLSKKMGDLSNIPSKDCFFLHSVSGGCEECSDCDGEILKYDDTEFCSSCGLGIEGLEKAGIKTKIGKKLKEDN